MFFNSANLFDSKTALLDDVKKAIYLPIGQELIPNLVMKPFPTIPVKEKKNKSKISKISTQLQPILIRPP